MIAREYFLGDLLGWELHGPLMRIKNMTNPTSSTPKLVVACALLVGLLMAGATSSQAQGTELFTWWQRQLLPLDFEAGSWIELERFEAAEGQSWLDTLRVDVLAADADGTVWVQAGQSSTSKGFVVHLDPANLAPDRPVLGAILAFFSTDDGRTFSPESLDSAHRSRFARRHLEDPFREPLIERAALADSSMGSQTISREAVHLSETQETRAPMGQRELIHATVLDARAVISPAVPILGLLEVVTTAETSSRWEGSGSGRTRPPQPPLYSEVRLRCVGFGREAPLGLPRGIASGQ